MFEKAAKARWLRIQNCEIRMDASTMRVSPGAFA
jgi:hypothetical protein